MTSSFDIKINNLSVEITEDYEGDKYHVVVFDTSQTPPTHEDTRGLESLDDVFKYLKELKWKGVINDLFRLWINLWLFR